MTIHTLDPMAITRAYVARHLTEDEAAELMRGIPAHAHDAGLPLCVHGIPASVRMDTCPVCPICLVNASERYRNAVAVSNHA